MGYVIAHLMLRLTNALFWMSYKARYFCSAYPGHSTLENTITYVGKGKIIENYQFTIKKRVVVPALT